MADSYVQVPADSTGKKIDAASMDVGANTVMRQRIVIGDNSATAQFATVTGGALVCTGTFNVSAMPAVTGTVNISGTAAVSLPANLGTVNNISAAVVLAAGSANIGSINNISATIAAVLAAGTANIGTLNNISATLSTVLAAGTANIGTINNISAAVVLAAGSNNIGTINNISANVTVVNAAGTANIGAVSLAAGTANIGVLNNISATVVVAGEVANGASLSTTNKPVLIGGNTSAGGAGGLMATLLLDTGGRVILAAGTNNIGAVSNAAGTALMGAVSLAAGTANIGFINNISATVTVAGTVSLGPGTANIGTLNDISRTVQVAIGTPFTLQGISTTVNVAVATPFTLQGISTTVNVAIATPFTVNNISAAVVLAAGSNNIGKINNISASVSIATGATGNYDTSSGATQTIPMIGLCVPAAGGATVAGTNAMPLWVNLNFVSTTLTAALAPSTNNIGYINNISATVTTVQSGFTPAIMSASHGPKCVTASTSANVTLIASPGAGANIYVTQLMVGNASATLTKARVGTSASASTVVQPLAASGGGFVFRFDPPWMLSASEACICSVKPNVADVFFTVNYFVR